MCGRFRLHRYALLRAVFATMRQIGFEEFSELDIHWWNIAPSQDLPIVRMDGTDRVLSRAKWGYIPAWAGELPKVRPINARAETVATSGLFRKSFNSRRCLIPADGFYEWQGPKPPRQPYFIHMKNDDLFAFAGLWDSWKPDPQSPPIETCVIITTQPNGILNPIHNRMPAIVQPKDYERWLNPANRGDQVADVICPYPDDQMTAYPVSNAVNNPRSDGPELSRPEDQH